MKVLAVNGRKFSKNVYRDALKSARSSSEPIDLLVENTDYFRTFKIVFTMARSSRISREMLRSLIC